TFPSQISKPFLNVRSGANAHEFFFVTPKIFTFFANDFREVAEWSKAHAWKVCMLQKGIEGSNPFLSANFQPCTVNTGLSVKDRSFAVSKSCHYCLEKSLFFFERKKKWPTT